MKITYRQQIVVCNFALVYSLAMVHNHFLARRTVVVLIAKSAYESMPPGYTRKLLVEFHHDVLKMKTI